MPKRPIEIINTARIGILGSGFIVSYRHCGFNPVAIASRSPENAQRVAGEH